MEHIQKIKSHFNNNFGKTILFGKWTHSVGAPILIVSGMARVSLKKFLGYNLIGTIPKTMLFLAIGYYFGQSYVKVNMYFGYVTVALFFIIVVTAAGYLFIKKRSNK